MLCRGDVDTQRSARLVAERHPVLTDAAAIHLLDQAVRDHLPLRVVDVPLAHPEIELVIFRPRACRGGARGLPRRGRAGTPGRSCRSCGKEYERWCDHHSPPFMIRPGACSAGAPLATPR